MLRLRLKFQAQNPEKKLDFFVFEKLMFFICQYCFFLPWKGGGLSGGPPKKKNQRNEVPKEEKPMDVGNPLISNPFLGTQQNLKSNEII